MVWNYRIVRYPDSQGFGLHEVYYDDEHRPWSMTADPASFVCDDEEGSAEVTRALRMALDDAGRLPVFDQPADGDWPGKAPGGDGEGVICSTPEELRAALSPDPGTGRTEDA